MLDLNKRFHYRYYRLLPDSIGKFFEEYKKHYYDEYLKVRSELLSAAFGAIDIGVIGPSLLSLYFPVTRDVSNLPLSKSSDKPKNIRGCECFLYKLTLNQETIKKENVRDILRQSRKFMSCLCFENYIIYIATGMGMGDKIKRKHLSFNATKLKKEKSFNLVDRISDETCFLICIPKEIETPNTINSNDFEEVSYGVYFDVISNDFVSNK